MCSSDLSQTVELTDRHLRLRAPQPGNNNRRLWLTIGGFVLLQVVLFLGLLLYFKFHR